MIQRCWPGRMSGLGYPTTRVEPIMDTRPEGKDFLLSPYILMTYGYRIKSIQGWDIPIICYYPMDYRIVQKASGRFPIRPEGESQGSSAPCGQSGSNAFL